MSVIRANPGFFVLRVTVDGSVIEHPVIAWKIEDNDFAHPLTTEATRPERYASGLLHPDGHVTTAYGAWFKSFDDWYPCAWSKLVGAGIVLDELDPEGSRWTC